MRLEDETRAIRKITEISSRPIPGTWRRKIYNPIFNTTSKLRRRATSRILQYYGETRMIKLSSRPAPLCHPSELATLADTNLRDVNFFREEPPRSTTVGDVLSNKEQDPLHPKIHIPTGNPGMYPWCPLTTADRAQKRSHFRPPTQKTSQSIPLLKTTSGPHIKTKSISTPRSKTKSILIPVLKSSQFGFPTQKLS